MWKYVTRRIRDTFERSVNHFDRRSATGVVNSPSNVSDEKNKRTATPCRWFGSRKCWSSFQDDNNTNSNRWNFEQLNRNWIGAITWSSALVIGWYTSQIVHLKLKSCYRKERKNGCPSVNHLFANLHPYVKYVNENPVYLHSGFQIKKVIGPFTPTVRLISNESNGIKKERTNSGSTASDTSDDNLGEVLNSIENKLGLAAIENGQHQDGLNLLRSAANRNHAPALYNLGLCYEMGLGVPMDEKTAMELFRSAAALEHPGALYNLGIYYGQGRGGLTRNTETATRLLKLAAVQGQEEAITALKKLDVETLPSLQCESESDDDSWNFNYTPLLQNDAMIPTTTLFIEKVNHLQGKNFEATVY